MDEKKQFGTGVKIMALGVLLMFVGPCFAGLSLVTAFVVSDAVSDLEPAGFYECKLLPPNAIQGNVELMNDWMATNCELKVELTDKQAAEVIDGYQGPNDDRLSL